MAEAMNDETIKEIAAPAIAAAVCSVCAKGTMYGDAWGWFGIAGLGAAHALIWLAKSPTRFGGVFASETKHVEPDTWLVQKAENEYARFTTKIPFAHFQEVGKMVVETKAENLTTTIIELAFPNWSQRKQRALHTRLVGLLSAEEVGYINKMDNGWNKIVRPDGWNFWARVGNGMISPLEQKHIPYTPPQKMLSKNMSFKGHTQPPRAIMNLGEAA